jgi:hypothetical protein
MLRPAAHRWAAGRNMSGACNARLSHHASRNRQASPEAKPPSTVADLGDRVACVPDFASGCVVPGVGCFRVSATPSSTRAPVK